MILKNVQTTFTASFGFSRIGKTVTVTVLDSSGVLLGSGWSAGSVVELSDGTYGCAITFSETFTGYVKFSNTTDGLETYIPIAVVDDYVTDVAVLKKIETNRWKIASNQLVIYDDDAVTPLYTFNLLKEGAANGAEPDERVPV